MNRDLQGAIGPGGLLARYYLSKTVGGRSEVVLNDLRRLERLRLSEVSGIFDTRPVRENRQPNSFAAGSSRGRRVQDELVITFTGVAEAGNAPRLYDLRTALMGIGYTFDLDEQQDDGTIRIVPLDLLGGDKRGGGWGIDYFYNLVSDTNFDGEQWTSITSLFSIYEDESKARSLGVAHPWKTCGRSQATIPNGASAYVVSSPTPVPIRPGSPIQASIAIDITGSTAGIKAYMSVEFFDASGSSMGEVAGSDVGPTGASSGKSTLSTTAPAGARSLRMRLVLHNVSAGSSATANAYFGVPSIVVSSAPQHPMQKGTPGVVVSDIGGDDFCHGLRGHNFVAPLGPFTEVYWSFSGATKSTKSDGIRFGRRYDFDPRYDYDIGSGMRRASAGVVGVLTSNGSGNIVATSKSFAVEPGASYSASIGVMGSQAKDVELAIVWKNASASVGAEASVAGPEGVDDYAAFEVSGVAPAGSVRAELRLTISNTGSGVRHVVSDVMMVFGQVVDHQDGDSPGWEWIDTETSWSPSQSIYSEYVVEKVDFEVRSPEVMRSRSHVRDFMVTAKCRDPRIYESRYQEVEMIADESDGAAFTLSNPATYPYTVLSETNFDTFDTSLGYTQIVPDSTSSPANVLFYLNDSVAGRYRYTEVLFKFFRPTTNSDAVHAACNVINPGVNNDRLYANFSSNGAFSLNMVYSSGTSVLVSKTFSYPDYFDRYVRIRAWTELVGGELIFKAVATKNNSIDEPDIELEYNLSDHPTPGLTAYFDVNSRGVVRLVQKLDDAYSRPVLYEYREGSAIATPLVAIKSVGGMNETPFSVTIDGPISSPSLRAESSGVSIITDIELDTGESATINSDGSIITIGGDTEWSESNLLRGTFLGDLRPATSETFRIEGIGMEADQTKATIRWRNAL